MTSSSTTSCGSAYTPEKIFHLANQAFSGDFEPETIKKWLKTFYRRFVSQQFKRSCLPDGVKVGSVTPQPQRGLADAQRRQRKDLA